MLKIYVSAALVSFCLPAFDAVAQKPSESRPQALKKLIECRSIADQTPRLACYDREVAAVDAAEARKDLVVVDREQLRETRRSLFGLTLPNLAVFGADSPDQEEFSRIESRIKSVSQLPDGKWTFVLEDGARWVQNDSRELAVYPKSGHPIAIRKAAIGSYLANVNKQTAIRVTRVR